MMKETKTYLGLKGSLACASLFVATLTTASVADSPVPADTKQIAERMHVTTVSAQSFTVPADTPEHWSVQLTINDEPMTVDLTRHSLRSDQFRVRVDDGTGALREVPAPAVSTYRGAVRGQPDSVAAATLVNGGVTATLLFPDGSMWHVQPVARDGKRAAGQPVMHAVYRDQDVMPGDWSCGVKVEEGEPNGQGGGAANGSGGLPELAEIAFDADFEFYQDNGSSVDNTIEDIESVLNAVSAIYEQDVQIIYEITEIIVRTSEPDPYSSSFAGSLLNQFAIEWNTNQAGIPRDVAHLMTGRNLSGSTIGIAALGVICIDPNSSYGLSQSNFSFNFAARVALTAHELGHNWNATHCNSQPDCRIMCSGLGGCTGIIDSFGTLATNQIVSFRNNTFCTPPAQLPPENNICDDPLLATLGQQSFTTENATTTGPSLPGGGCFADTDGQINQDVWFGFPFGCAGELTVSVCNSNFDTRLAVYTTQCPTADDEPVACSDDDCGDGSTVTFQASGSQAYFIRIGGAGDATGEGMLEITCVEAPCPADIAGDDGEVNVSDLLELLGAWGPCDSCEQDLDDSGAVDVADLLEMLGAWGPCQ